MLRVVLVTTVSEVWRALRADLGATGPDRLPPLSGPRGPWALRWLRWLPHGLVVILAGALAAFETKEFTSRLGVSAVVAVVLAVAQLGCVVVALFRPLNALWLSLTLAVVVAVTAKSYGAPEGGPVWPWFQDGPWPWPIGGLLAHALVLLLVSLRVRVRVTGEALLLSLLVGPVLESLTGDHPHFSTVSYAAVAFGVVVVVGASLRGRREAGARLVEQEVLTAEERTRRTVLEERSRIARELHDVVAHHMSVISIQAQVAPLLVKDPPEELRENLAGIRQNALDALTELRRVLGVLRAEGPDGAEEAVPHAPLPTLDRLDALLDNARAAGLDVTCRVVGERRPSPPGVELSAYRIVQEALSNAIRHAPGAVARVELAYAGPGLGVRVVNSAPGKGGRAGHGGPGTGHGLLGMRERTAMLGGELAAGPTPDGGYEVSAFLPTEGETG